MSESADFSGLSCELTIPFSWAVSSVLNNDELDQLERDNYGRLQIMQGLEESSETLEDLPGLAHEIHRLDFKINLLLELVGHIATKESPLPESHALILNRDFIQWSSPQVPPDVGKHVKTELFLERRFPFSLVLMGVVDAVSSENALSKVTVKLHPQEATLLELWEKFIFRTHRRHIARMKREGNPR